MKIIVTDTETSGLPDWKQPRESPQQPHIVQCASLLIEDVGDVMLLKTMNRIVRPNGWTWDENDEAFKVHGITYERAMDEGVPEAEVVEEFHALQAQADMRVALTAAQPARGVDDDPVAFLAPNVGGSYALVSDRDASHYRTAFPVYRHPIPPAPSVGVVDASWLSGVICEARNTWPEQSWLVDSDSNPDFDEWISACVIKALASAQPAGLVVVPVELAALYEAASAGFHIQESCGPEGKFLHVSKFRTLENLHKFSDAWTKAMLLAKEQSA